MAIRFINDDAKEILQAQENAEGAPGYSANSQQVQIQKDDSFSPRKLDFKGLINNVTASVQVTYMGGHGDADLDASWNPVVGGAAPNASSLAMTGTWGGVLASHCQPGIDGVCVIVDGNTFVPIARFVVPAALAR